MNFPFPTLKNTSGLVMDQKETERIFVNIMENEPNVSAGMAAIKTLLTLLKHDTLIKERNLCSRGPSLKRIVISNGLREFEKYVWQFSQKAGTIQELHCTFRNAIETMKKSKYPVTAVASGCELFMRFITLAALDNKNFQECKQLMLNRGQLFFKKLNSARDKVAKLASGFIVDGTKILTHSKSRVVLQAMKEATNLNKRFQVFVTTSAPDNSGRDMCKELEKLGVPCTVILDSAVGYIMESVDMIMVGAEGVVESGGVINKVGSYTIALCAREASKPFYVLTESFKFVRLYPLNQRDLPVEFKYTCSYKDKDISKADPLVDYTPPVYITLLFTDLGILTPSAVSDELIKLYL